MHFPIFLLHETNEHSSYTNLKPKARLQGFGIRDWKPDPSLFCLWWRMWSLITSQYKRHHHYNFTVGRGRRFSAMPITQNVRLPVVIAVVILLPLQFTIFQWCKNPLPPPPLRCRYLRWNRSFRTIITMLPKSRFYFHTQLSAQRIPWQSVPQLAHFTYINHLLWIVIWCDYVFLLKGNKKLSSYNSVLKPKLVIQNGRFFNRLQQGWT